MKFIPSQVAAFMESGSGRRNVRLLLRFFFILLGMICLYSVLFHVIMQSEREGNRDYSWFTGFYWTLTVMSTLGYGDITFNSDLGRFFSTIVLLSGMLFLLMLMPFTLIEFFYAPWVEAQARARAPRDLPSDTHDHVILTNYDAVTSTLIKKLNQFGYPYVLLVPEPEMALKLHDDGVNVMVGDPDHPDTYDSIRLNRAALVAATGTDVVNTNIAFTVRERSKSIPILTTANLDASVDIQQLAGSSRVFKLGDLMGQALARRTSGADAVAHVIGRFDKLLIAEATAAGTPLVGKTLEQVSLPTMAGISIIGVWERGQFQTAGPNTEITGNTVLVMAGSSEQIGRYNELFCIYHVNQNPVVIIGGGRVGRATGDSLLQREVDFRLVELLPERVRRFGERAVIGDAADLEVLEKAGINEAPAVIITPHDDDMNVYLTIYCRKLRPDIQIISRCVRDRNVSTLHRAGADFVMSYASMGANIIFNYLKRSDILMIAEGLNIFKVKLPEILVGKSLLEAEVRKKTGCTVIAVQQNGDLQINPDPHRKMEASEEVLLIGDAEAESRWFEVYSKSKD